MTTALVVGFGSIGQRHARILTEMGCRVEGVSRRPLADYPGHGDLETAVRSVRPDYVVLATETARHLPDLQTLIRVGYSGRVLVEKPLAIDPVTGTERSGAGALSAVPFGRGAVAYNLRFHPVLQALAAAVSGQGVLSVQAYCGQYLPDWRPGTDYRQSYSADPAAGGGVLRDLSHELDYLLWLFGPWHRLAALGGRIGSLEIRSDDCWSLLLEQARCPMVSLQINYFDRPGQRQIVVNTPDHTYRADLIRSSLTVDGVEQTFPVIRDGSYRAQHAAMLGDDDSAPLCSLEQGNAVMVCLAAAERAATEQRWVEAE